MPIDSEELVKDSTYLKIEVEVEMEGTLAHFFESGLFLAVPFVAFLQVFFSDLIYGLFAFDYKLQVLVGLRLTVTYFLSEHGQGRHSTDVKFTTLVFVMLHCRGMPKYPKFGNKLLPSICVFVLSC